MKQKTIYICVNGIRTFPGQSKNWNGKAVTWLNTTTIHKAEKVEYFSLTFTRALHNKARAHKLYRTLSFYRGWKIVIICHSNGGDVVLDCLNDYNDWPSIHAIHFVCSAGEADFNKNKLNKHIKDNRIGKVNIYVAGKDFALKLAHTVIGKLLGYGTMGLHGATNVDESIKHKIKTFWRHPWSNYGHSDCWLKKNFDTTMRLFL